MPLSLVSWNVNGIRACLKKGLIEFLKAGQYDIFCLQEIKISEPDLMPLLPLFENLGYSCSWSVANKKGYSGVFVGSRQPTLSTQNGLPDETDDPEGRVIAVEYQDFWLLNTYFPNAQRELKRLDYKLAFNEQMTGYCQKLRAKKPIILTGDLNVAHKEIDLANPKSNMKNAGFSKEERHWLDEFIDLGYLDSFRMFNELGGQYTWWTYRQNARERNIGWRLDYFITSQELQEQLVSSTILSQVTGSDHCPVLLELK